MKLNIVTAGANSVGTAILQKLANSDDITLALSRRRIDLVNVFNFNVTDLADREITQQELVEILSIVDAPLIDEVKIFHNCCYAVAEIPQLNREDPLFQTKPELLSKLVLQDDDGDGIDDRTYHALLSTFRNVFDAVISKFLNKKIAIGTICSLTDHKRYIPTIFQSMVKTNKILRDELGSLVTMNQNIHGVCISASTVKTDTESNFRSCCTDQAYWVTGQEVANSLLESLDIHTNTYTDIPLYKFNPKYESYYRYETDAQMTQRIKKEIGLH